MGWKAWRSFFQDRGAMPQRDEALEELLVIRLQQAITQVTGEVEKGLVLAQRLDGVVGGYAR